MELGYVVRDACSYQEVIVCCPEGFWRKGNVDIICERDDVYVYNNLSRAIRRLNDIISDI